MSETKRTQRMKRIRALTESALMVALATALSFVVLWEMPMGGSVTLASMLPVMLIGIKYGSLQGVGTAFVFSGIQLAQAIAKGNVFIYTETAPLAVAVALLDYILPYTVIGLAGIFRSFRPKKCPRLGCYLGMLAVVFARFVCHFFSGVLIWGQWAEDMHPVVYSILYNGGFLLPDLAIAFLVAVYLLEIPVMQKALDIPR